MINLNELVQYSKTLKVLYVEDSEKVRLTTLNFLENFFTDITVAVDGKEGLEYYQQNGYDLILTDINMPNLNGLDMIKFIKKLDPDVSVLVLSAYDENEYFLQSIKLGIDGYLLKPIDNKQFVELLFKIIKKIKNERDIERNISLLKQYECMFDSNSIVTKTNKNGIITHVNNKFCILSGYSKEELINQNHNIIRHPDTLSIVYKDMWKTIKEDKKIWQGILKNIAKDQSTYYVNMTITPILDLSGEVIEYISLQYDISNIMNPKKQLEEMIDASLNVFAFMIQMDDFVGITKLYGETIARKLDQDLADILLSTPLAKYNFEKVFSLGDGRYVFASQEDDYDIDIEEAIEDIKDFQHKINKIKLVITDDIQYDVSVLVSLAYGEDVLENLTYGIEELDKTKEIFIEVYDLADTIHETAQQNMKTITMVKTAIENSKIVSYFQPIVDNATKEIVKHESLVRLIDENGKVLSPFFFLDVSKKGKYYSQITNIVLKNSFEVVKKVDHDISMNISALDIELPSTQEYIFSLLEEYKEYANRVVFELLEDEGVKDFKTIVEFIKKVKPYGVKIAIDDFGAGYSNFERLLDYQPDILKIDGCLIKDILEDKYSLSIVKTIVSFAKEQDIQTVAEFVENEETYLLLKDLGVDFTQGYYFGKPMPFEEISN